MPTDFGTKVSTDAGSSVRDSIRGLFGAKDGGGLGVRTVSNAVGALVAAMTSIVFAIFSAIFRIASTIAVLYLEGYRDARDSNQDAINSIAAEAVGDVLMVDIDASSIPKAGGGSGQAAAAGALGGKIHDALEGALGGTPGDDGNAGAQAARAFTGFNVSAAVSAAMLGIMTEMESLGFLKEWHHLGEDIMQSLGLNRLHRRAFGPLIDTLIVKPYTYFLMAKYRPDRLNLTQVMTAMLSGRMDEATGQGELARLGYSDDFITELRLQHQPQLTIGEVDALLRWGDIDQTEAVRILQQQGWPADHAAQKLLALERTEADGAVKAYAGEVLSMAQQRFIDSATYTSLIDRLPLHDSLKQQMANRLGVFLDSPSKRLTLGELIYLIERNQVTDADITTWALNSGYSQDDAFTLQIYADLKDTEYDAKQAAAAAKAAAAAAKKKAAQGGGSTTPPA